MICLQRDVHPMLVQRRRRLANIVPTIAERSAFAGLHWMPVAPPHRHVKKVIDSNVEKNSQSTDHIFACVAEQGYN